MKRMEMAVKAALVCAVVAVPACQSGLDSAQNAALETDDQKASYAIGLQIGMSLEPAGDHVAMDALLRGLQDAMAGRDPVLADDELQAVMMRFTTMMQEEQQAEAAAVGETNRTAGEAFLAQNAAKDGVMVTPSGLQYEVLREGDGAKPTPENQVTIHYKGTLIDGTEFDTSYDGDPATFSVGGVIAGFAEALQLMSVGSQYRFVIPGDLAYGPQGNGQMIGPNATIVFEIELIGIPE